MLETEMNKTAAASQELLASVLSNDAEMCKSAMLTANDYFRDELRENGIRRQITPPTAITAANFDPDVDSDIPSMIVERAPHSSGAFSVPFETGTQGAAIHTRRTRVEFGRIMTPKYEFDPIRLETTKLPFLDILYDLLLKDIMDQEDTATINVDKAICGTIDTPNAGMGLCRYIHAGTLGRGTFGHLQRGMYKAPGHLQAATFLMNYSTYLDFGELDRTEIGGDLAQDIFLNGTQIKQVDGVKLVITTKDDLVPDNDVFIYPDAKYYGGFYVYNDVTMVNDVKDGGLSQSFFAHECIGASVINTAGVARASLTGTRKDWVTGQ